MLSAKLPRLVSADLPIGLLAGLWYFPCERLGLVRMGRQGRLARLRVYIHAYAPAQKELAHMTLVVASEAYSGSFSLCNLG